MATMCRETKKKRINRHKLAVIQAYTIGIFVMIGGVTGILIGRATAPTDTVIETKTVTVEVPVLADSLPEVGDFVELSPLRERTISPGWKFTGRLVTSL